MAQGPVFTDNKIIPKGSVLNGWWEIPIYYGIRWFKCKLKPPKMYDLLSIKVTSNKYKDIIMY